MIEDIAIAIIRQASLLTKPQQEEFATRAAEAIATLINSTETEIDDVLVGQIALPLARQVVDKLSAIV